MESIVVTYKTVSITCFPWTHPSGRDYWRFKKSDGSQVTRSTLDKAKAAAKNYAQEVYRGSFRISDLTPDQVTLVKRFIDASPSLSMVNEFLAWKGKHRPTTKLREVMAEFIASKKNTSGHYHLRNLTRYLLRLEPLADKSMADITASDLRSLLPIDAAPRTLANIRQPWVTLWSWAARNEKIPKDVADVPAILDLPPVVRGIPEIYTPAELAILLENVRPAYLPWLALAAFAGIRTEEVAPIKHSKKPALDWSDIHWDRKLIIVRPETSKTAGRRVIPIVPALEAWLMPVAQKSGRMAPRIPPSAGEGRIMSETTRIGKLIGGWKRNALRHSFITYRAALVGISQTAMEAGNSESVARRSYLDAQGKDVAAEWFAIMPKCSPNVHQKRKSA